jgi:hypothetical protein
MCASRMPGVHRSRQINLSLPSQLMNRSLALYLLILDFFLFLIAGAETYLLRHQAVLMRFDFLFALGALFVCPACSIIYVFYTRNSRPLPDPEEGEKVIDEILSHEATHGTPLSNSVKACGVVASLLALSVLAETGYGLFRLFREDLLLIQFRTNSSLSVVLVVFLFNAFCQPWYVWRTFLNVNTPKTLPR